MNKITMMCEEDKAKTTVERTTEDVLDIGFMGRCFYEFLKGIGFEEETINNILKTEELDYI